MNVDEVAVLVEIRQVLARYCRGIDRADGDVLRSAFHPGATVHVGPVAGGTDAFIEQFLARVAAERAAGDHRCAMHHLTNVLVLERTEDTAFVESYYMAFNPIDPQGERALNWAAGRYLDVFRLLDGEWRIAERTVLMDFTRHNISGEPSTSLTSGFPQGTRGRDDPSYAFIAGTPDPGTAGAP